MEIRLLDSSRSATHNDGHEQSVTTGGSGDTRMTGLFSLLRPPLTVETEYPRSFVAVCSVSVRLQAEAFGHRAPGLGVGREARSTLVRRSGNDGSVTLAQTLDDVREVHVGRDQDADVLVQPAQQSPVCVDDAGHTVRR